MKIIYSALVAFIFFISFISPGSAQPASNLSQTDNQFAFDLYSLLAADPGNIFFSPYSLSSALEMAYEGAQGETAEEMGMVLHINSEDTDRHSETSAFIQQINRPDKAYELSVANALWGQKYFPFKQEYLKSIEGTYWGEARNLDFAADPEGSRRVINTWVSQKTNDRINDILPAKSINSSTRLVLTNAVYFKGKWVAPFKKELTRQNAFWLTPDKSVLTDMMELHEISFYYTENDQVQVLELPYKGNDLSMLIILPRSKDIQSMEKTLTLDTLRQWQEGMTMQMVNVFFPKFKFELNYQMKDKLIEMGMKSAFEKSADFSGMADLQPDEHLYIDQVYHNAWIDTDEEGTEAAAATAVVMMQAGAMMVPLQQKVFRADHPFIFLIQDNKSGHILFMGRVSDPREK